MDPKRRRRPVDPQLRRQAIELARKRLEKLLGDSEWFRQADGKERERLRRRIDRLIDATAGPLDLRHEPDAVEFPEFVARLVSGVFEAVVDSSLQQMEAYLDLLEDVTKGLESVGDSAVRRQLLATLVLMGVSRFRIDAEGITVRAPRRDKDDEDED